MRAGDTKDHSSASAASEPRPCSGARDPARPNPVTVQLGCRSSGIRRARLTTGPRDHAVKITGGRQRIAPFWLIASIACDRDPQCTPRKVRQPNSEIYPLRTPTSSAAELLPDHRAITRGSAAELGEYRNRKPDLIRMRRKLLHRRDRPISRQMHEPNDCERVRPPNS